MGAVPVTPSPARRRGRAAPQRCSGLLLSLLLVAGLLPAAAHAATATTATTQASIAVAGLDRLVIGAPSPVDVVVKVAARGKLRGDTPLRLVGTLTSRGKPATGLAVGLARGDGSVDALDVDDAGRFVFPSEDRAPLSLAATPALESAAGHTVRLRLTVPDGAGYALTVALVESNERSASVVRRAGPDRVATAVEVSRHTFNPGVDVAYVARADDFPDALAAGPVAGLGGHPILLTHTAALPAATAAELQRLQPGRIVALGGARAVSDAVLGQLRPLTTGTVTRLSGADRFATAAAIALERFTAPVDTVFVATGGDFADALAGGPAAATLKAPVLLVSREAIPAATAAALTALRPRRIVVLGGDAAVSDAVVGRLGDLAGDGVIRWSGRTRFETAAAVSARTFAPESTSTVYLATGQKFPDALAGVPAAVLDGAPLLLVTAGGIPEAAKAEITRLRPGAIVLLGGGAVVGESVADEAVLLTRDIAPDRDRFETLAASGAVAFAAGPGLRLDRPEPASLRPRDRFALTFATPRSGTYRLAYRRQGTTAWKAFPNRTAEGTTGRGERRVALNAPLDDGVFDLRLTYTPTGGKSSAVVAAAALQVALTFPPPLISSLVEGVEDQSQLVAVRPIGGLATGTVLEVRLGSAERAGADYPLDPAKLTLVRGNGVAELVVGRDQEAMIRYTAGPGDRVPGGAPTDHPLLTFRIDGIDVADSHEAHVGQFFRFDIMHGVQRIFTVGGGAGVASPTVGDLQRASPHTFQIVSFAVGTPIDPFESVTIDLSEAEQAGVDYSEAFAFVLGDGGHEAEPAHEPPPGLGEAFLDVEPGESAVLTFVAGPDGVPSVQPEGPTVQIFVGGIAVPDATLAPRVTFTREDTGSSASTRFRVRPMELRDASATSLPTGAAAAQQTISVTLDGALSSGETLYVDLTRAQRSGLDYRGADITVLSGTGSAAWDDTEDEWEPDFARVAYTAGFGDADGTVVTLRLDGVATPAADSSELVHLFRSDSWARTSAAFDVGAGSPIVGPFASDLGADGTEESQIIGFAVRAALAAGETVTVDLSDAEAGAVSYADASVFAYVEEDWETVADVTLDVDAGTSAILTYTAGAGGLAAGQELTVVLEDVQVADLEADYEAVFARSGVAQTATARFATRRLPGVTAATATPLASGANNQTQTLSATLVGDLAAGEILEVELSGAEAGAARYGGAAVTVTQGSGTAEVLAFSGSFAVVLYRAGPTDLDGATVELELSGVNTDAGDETHAADFVRYDSWRPASALFDIGAGGPWVGRPHVSELAAASPWEWQGVSFRLVRPLAAGEQVEIDLSSAEAGGVAYGGVELVSVSRGSAELDVEPGASATLTYTAGPGGVPAGRAVWIDLEGIVTDAVEEEHTVTFVDVATGDVATTTFKVVHWDGHGFQPVSATDLQLQALRGRTPRPGAPGG